MKVNVIITLVAIVIISFVGCKSQDKPVNTQPQQLSEQQIADITQKSVDAAEKKVQVSLDKKEKELQAEKEKNRKLEEKLAITTKTPKLRPQLPPPTSELKQTQTTQTTQNSDKHNTEEKDVKGKEKSSSTEEQTVVSSDNLLIIKFEGNLITSSIAWTELCCDHLRMLNRLKKQIKGIEEMSGSVYSIYLYHMVDDDVIPHRQILNDIKSFFKKEYGKKYLIKFIGSW